MKNFIKKFVKFITPKSPFDYIVATVVILIIIFGILPVDIQMQIGNFIGMKVPVR